MALARRRAGYTGICLVGAILILSLGSDGHVIPQVHERRLLQFRLLQLLAKAEDAGVQDKLAKPHLGGPDGCIGRSFCATVRDVAIALGRPELIERAVRLHKRPCAALVEAQVVLAARQPSRSGLQRSLAAMNAQIACLHGRELAVQAATHGSIEFALAVCDRIEQLSEETTDEKLKVKLREELLMALVTVARAVGADAALRARTLSVMEKWGDGPLLGCLSCLSSDMLAYMAAPQECDSRSHQRFAGEPIEDGAVGGSVVRAMFEWVDGRAVADAWACGLLDGDCAAESGRGREFLRSVAQLAHRRSSPILRRRLYCAVAGALLRLGAVDDALPLIGKCSTDLRPDSLSREVIAGLDGLLKDINAAAACGSLDQRALEALATHARAFPPGVRSAFLAAVARGMLKLARDKGALTLIEAIQEEIVVTSPPSCLAQELVRLCYALTQYRGAQSADALEVALQLARSMTNPGLKEKKAISILCVVESLVQARRRQEAAALVDEMIPLFRIPLGDKVPKPEDLWRSAYPDVARACYTSGCNMIAVRLAAEGHHQEALEWLQKGARVAFVRDPDEEFALPPHDDREAVMRAFIAAWRVSADTLYLHSALKMAQRFWAHEEAQIAGGWIAILALVSSEFGDQQEAFRILSEEAQAPALRQLKSYDKVVVLLAFADAFSLLGAQPEARRLIAQCLRIARADEALREEREARGHYEGVDVTCFPPIARTLVWQGERLGDIELIRQGAALMLAHAWDGYFDIGPLGVRVAQAAVRFRSDPLFRSALALGERGDGPILGGFGIAHHRLLDIMLIGGRSGEPAIIDQCEQRADIEPDPYRRTELCAWLVRGILQHGRVRVPRGWQEKIHSLETARAWLEHWNVQVVQGRYEFILPTKPAG